MNIDKKIRRAFEHITPRAPSAPEPRKASGKWIVYKLLNALPGVASVLVILGTLIVGGVHFSRYAGPIYMVKPTESTPTGIPSPMTDPTDDTDPTQTDPTQTDPTQTDPTDPPADPTDPLHTHTYSETVTAPTCTEKGYTTFACDCGDRYIGNEVAALGHSFGQWVTVIEPTESAAGKAERTCAGCGQTETKELGSQAHTHTYTETVTAPTCTEKGYSTFTCECGDSHTGNEVAAAHSWGAWTVVQAHSCSQDEIQERKCAACGTAEREVTKLAGHDVDEQGECQMCKLNLSASLQFELNSDGESYCVVGIDKSVDGTIAIPAVYEGLPVTTIGRYAFKNENFTALLMPDSITYIDYDAFRYSTSLKNVYYLGTLKQWLNIKMESSPCQYNANLYLSGELLVNLVIPAGDHEGFLYGNSFGGCGSLETVTIQDGITEIGSSAFRECINLKKVTLGKNVKIIGSNAFHVCTALTQINFPDGLTKIRNQAFTGCEGLTEVILPDSVQEIGDMAFWGSINLTSVTIGGGVQKIFDMCFGSCSALREIHFGGTVEQWNALTQMCFMNLNKDCIIYCTDGETKCEN